MIQGQLGGYVKNKSYDYFFFFFLAGWIILLIDIFVFNRKPVSLARKTDVQIWVTLQINLKGKLKTIS